MTLLQRARQLVDALAQLEESKRLVQNVQGFNTRATEIEQALEAFSKLAELVSAFRSHNIPFTLSLDLASLRQALETIATDYKNDPNILLKPDNKLTRMFWNPLKNSPNQIRQDLEISWKKYAQTILPRLDNELLDIFEKLPSTRAQARIIRQLQQHVQQLAGSLPSSENDIQTLVNLANRIGESWQNLETTEIPTSVMTFLKAACGAGASLDLFTDEVRQWLSEHRLTQAFSISLASISWS
ncbi:MAG: hypothetical protein U1F76_14285 [Candidatus Competibacteraceae bacterium]